MKTRIVILLLLACTFIGRVVAQTYDTNQDVVQTFAGSGFSGYLDGVGQQTMFNGPSQIVSDSSSNIFVLDTGNGRIRKITPDGTVSTFSHYATNSILFPGGSLFSCMAMDHSNALLIPTFNGALLRIGNDGSSSTTSLSDLAEPYGVCVDSGNNTYISDFTGNKIYRYRTNGVLEVFAGSGNRGAADGNGVFTSFFSPSALASDAADNIYVWDSGNCKIRRINQNRDVVTIPGPPGCQNIDGMGSNANFSSVYSMCFDDSGNMILACGSCIRKMSVATNAVTMAGTFSQTGYTNGAGNIALFYLAQGVCVSQGMIFVADSFNNRVRNITFNPVAQPVTPANLQLSTYPGLQINGMVGRTYQIQTSPDMNTWNTVETVLLTSSPYLWFDQHPVGSNKFYRALLLP